MQFTPQQLSGGPKYNSAVKIGNWAEDRAKAELEAKDYEMRRTMGRLATASAAGARATNLQAVFHTHSADGKLRFGDTIQLKVSEEDAKGLVQTHTLANDIFNIVDVTRKTVAATAAREQKPLARTTFVITRAEQELESKSDVLNYGEPFQLASHPALREDKSTGYAGRPYLLESQPVSAFGGGGSGTAQSVQLAALPSQNTVWVVVAANGNRLATDGTPVPANADVAVYHRATNVALAATLNSRVSTSFGGELAVCCRTIKSTGRGAGGAALPGNRWQFVTAASPSAVPERKIPIMTPKMLLEQRVKPTILSRGGYGLRGLARSFRIMDDRGDGNLDKEDFKWGLKDYGVALTDEEFDVVLGAFDRDGNGLVSLTEFLAELRGELNETRKAAVARAFAKFDKDGSGKVTLADLRDVYDTSYHPGCKEGEVDPDTALSEFLSNWDVKDADGIITKAEFEQYYGDLSAGIDDDEYFVLMMTRAWKLGE